MLAACAGRAEGVNAQIRRIEFDFAHFGRFGHDRDGTGGGVNAALRFGLGDALNTVAAGLEFQSGVYVGAGQLDDDFAVAAQIGR